MVTASDISEQKQFIEQCGLSALGPNQTWYLVDTRWFKQWKRYVGNNSYRVHNTTLQSGESQLHPGPIDNSGILQSK